MELRRLADIDVHENVVRQMGEGIWRGSRSRRFPDTPGQMKPEQLEIDRLRREVAKLRAERDILKKCRSLLREGVDMKFGFAIAKHQFRLAGGMALRSAWRIEVWLPCLAETRHCARSREDEGIMPCSGKGELRGSECPHLWRASDLALLRAGSRLFVRSLHKIGERLMRAQTLRARPRRRAPPKDGGERSASAISPNVGSTASSRRTSPTANGLPTSRMSGRPRAGSYVAAGSSICSRAASSAGSMKAEMSAQLVTDALLMAIWRQRAYWMRCCITPTVRG